MKKGCSKISKRYSGCCSDKFVSVNRQFFPPQYASKLANCVRKGICPIKTLE